MTLLPSVVELGIGGEWVDVTASDRVLARDTITITRGRADWSSRVSPSTAALTLRNVDGRFSPRNPNSPYYGQLTRNTPLRVRIEGQTRTLDTFTRTETASWGVNDLGQEYSMLTGSSDFSVTGTRGRVSVPTPNVSRFVYVLGPADVDQTITVVGPVLATGADLKAGICARLTDADNFYSAQLQFNTDATMYLELNKEVLNVVSIIATDTTTGLTHVAGTLYKVRFQLLGSSLRAKCWLAADAEPAPWNIEATDTDHSGPGGVGARCRSSSGNTNAHPLTFDFDDFTSPDARFVGEVSEWPARWDLSGTDVSVPIVASGILRRLGQGASPLRSPLTRGTLAINGLVAYWPMEEESGATQFTAAVGGSPVKGVVFTPAAATEPGLDGSLPVATIGTGARLSAQVTGTGAAGEWLMRAVVYIPTAPAAAMRLLEWHTTGTAQGWHIRIDPAGTDSLDLQAFDADNVNILTAVFTVDLDDLYGKWFMIEAGATQVGANIDYHLVYRSADGDAFGTTGTLNSRTAGVPKSIALIGDAEYRCGHVSVYDENPGFFDSPAIADLLGGRAGETAVDRATRLCQEEGVPLVVVGTSAGSELLGAQRVATLVELLQDAAEADGGILFEPRDALAVGLRTRASLYSQTPAVEVGYTDLSPSLEPVDDDQLIRNDVTVKRFNGSEARAVRETGPLSVLPPPDGVGRYDESVSLNIETDERLEQVAAWRRHLGTWDEARYPQIPVRVPYVANPGLAADLARLDIGDVLTVDNPPAWLPPDLIEAMAHGYVERLGTHAHLWELTFNCTPAAPFTVGFYNDGVSRYESSGTTRAGSVITSTQTSITLTIATGTPFWTTDAGHFPFDINIGGERMTVTDIDAPAGQTQLFTVTRSVNGVVKPHPVGSSATLWRPARYAL